jgi:hypothetical protein
MHCRAKGGNGIRALKPLSALGAFNGFPPGRAAKPAF